MLIKTKTRRIWSTKGWWKTFWVNNSSSPIVVTNHY